jgi:methylated-DNA-[protein]-cysteine S-methyltransferase
MGYLEVTHNEHFIFKAVLTPQQGKEESSALDELIRFELGSYFQNSSHQFKLPLKPAGSPYQLKVWNALLTIPVGSTLTYGEMAQQLHSAPRAIGQACKRNPLAVFVPCHRVVGKTSIGGFMGKLEALNYKKALLEHESRKPQS